MASNYNRKSASSGSHRRAQAPRGGSRPPRGPQRPYSPAPGARLTSVRVGDLPQSDHGSRARRTYQRYLVRLGALAAAVAEKAIVDHLRSHALPRRVRMVCHREETAALYRQTYNLWYAEEKKDRL